MKHKKPLVKEKQQVVADLSKEILEVHKMLKEAPVPTQDRHFLNLKTGQVDDPTGLEELNS